MRIEVKPIDAMSQQKEAGVQPYAVELYFTDRMVRLGTLTHHPPSGEAYVKHLYREHYVPVFDDIEAAAHAIAEYEMGRHIADEVPMHLAAGVPR